MRAMFVANLSESMEAYVAINGSPRNGAILMCDFNAHELELASDGNMVKTRPVIVLSPQPRSS